MWRLVIAAIACVLGLASAVVAVVDTSSGSAQADANAFQRPGPRTMLMQESSGKCADATAGTDGTRVTLRACDPGALSQWWDEPGDGTIRSAKTELCLDVAGARTAPGTRVQTAWCTHNPAQRWSFEDSFRMSSRLASGQCLDIATQFGEKPADGTELSIWWCDPTSTRARINTKQAWSRRTEGAPAARTEAQPHGDSRVESQQQATGERGD
ncbi:RICIN domain-containing protein, partial [Virgisporangium aliadipatigenens]|uniref:RICIN domain-containing protein n=1 Tax=Virgisporangium aliadipatigenens TaxID=741659 RepID=UPI00194532F4